MSTFVHLEKSYCAIPDRNYVLKVGKMDASVLCPIPTVQPSKLVGILEAVW